MRFVLTGRFGFGAQAPHIATTGRGRRKTQALTLAVLFVCIIVLWRHEPHSEAKAQTSSLLIDDPAALARLERSGFAFADVVGQTRFAVIAATVANDMVELGEVGRPEGSAPPPRRPFQPRWLTLGGFELIGVVNRIDRAPFDPPGSALCGEVRLVYRLTFAPFAPLARPVTRLPMTVSVRIPQPQRAGDGDCRRVAQRWQSDPDAATILRELPPFAKVEINFQSVHVPATRTDMDDNAEYVLRTFTVEGSSLVPDTLFNTPRPDLTARERTELATWIVEHLDAIDHGTAVLPEEFLATREVSISPRGLTHLQNRPFSRLFPDARAAFGGLSLRTRAFVTTPELLVRRLDEGTCPGCHQSRGVAGFHLLGEERDPGTTFNAIAVGRSPHLTADLEWRARVLASIAGGKPPPSRPFAGYPRGRYGDPCGLADGFAEWTCAPGFECRDVHHGDVGACAPTSGGAPGDPCENVRARASSRPEGAVISPSEPDVTCRGPSSDEGVASVCVPNWLGFTGGMCSRACPKVGTLVDGAICAPLPLAGYENDCLASLEPIEKCLKRHSASALLATCSAARPCRDDYICARVPGADVGTGACVPPYFVFQLRGDGPRLDR